MKHAIAILSLCAVCAGSGHAFVFHDPVHTAQTVAYKIQNHQQMLQQITKSTEMVARAQEQIQKFQQYRQVFDQYYGTFNACYRAIQHGNWERLATTINAYYLAEIARRQEEISAEDAARVRQEAQDNGLISGDSLTEGDLEQQIDDLQNTQYYQSNTAFQTAVNQYLEKQRYNYQYNNAALTKIAATIRMIQSRSATIARLEEQNQQLSTGDDQQSVVAQMALQNQILLEQVKQNNEVAELTALLLARQIEAEEQMQKSLIINGTHEESRTGVLDQLLAPLQDAPPAQPKRKR